MASMEEIELRVTALEKRWKLTDREQSTMRHLANIALGDIDERFDMITSKLADIETKHDLYFKEANQRMDGLARRFDELSQRVDALHDDNKALLLANSQQAAATQQNTAAIQKLEQKLDANVALILAKLDRLAP